MTTDLNASGATQQRRDEWKRLAEAATEGPWEADTYACGGTDCGCPVEGWGRVLRGNREHIVCGSPCQGEDVRFIAAARTAVPALIAEVEAVEASRDAVAKLVRCRFCNAPWDYIACGLDHVALATSVRAALSGKARS